MIGCYDLMAIFVYLSWIWETGDIYSTGSNFDPHRKESV